LNVSSWQKKTWLKSNQLLPICTAQMAHPSFMLKFCFSFSPATIKTQSLVSMAIERRKLNSISFFFFFKRVLVFFYGWVINMTIERPKDTVLHNLLKLLTRLKTLKLRHSSTLFAVFKIVNALNFMVYINLLKSNHFLIYIQLLVENVTKRYVCFFVWMR
jgi:hypothetical protein